MPQDPHCGGPYLSLTVKVACKTCEGSHVLNLTLTIHNKRAEFFLLYCLQYSVEFKLAVLPVTEQ